MVAFKICCIRSIDEADLAIDAGARAVGLVGAMPSGPGRLEDDAISEIADHVKSRTGGAVWATLLSSRREGDALAAHVIETGADALQIVDTPMDGAYKLLRARLPNLRLIQVIHVESDEAIEHARAAAAYVDVILLDSGKPNAPVKTLGGTGEVHDWIISRKIVQSVDVPVFLAGGLTPENVGEAIEQVQPFGVDVCSGLRDRESGFQLEPEKLSAFVAGLSA